MSPRIHSGPNSPTFVRGGKRVNSIIPVSAGGSSGPWAVGSVALDGVNDYVNFASASPWNFEYTSPFTIAARLYCTSNAHNAFVYTKQDTSNLIGVQFYLAKGTGGMNLGGEMFSGGGGGNNIRTDATDNSFALSSWQSVFWVNDGLGTNGSLTVYIGSATPTQSHTSAGTMTSIQNTQPAVVGLFPDGNILQFTGHLRCLGIYSKVATLTERTNWDTQCAALADPHSQIASCVSFVSFNIDAGDSVGTVNGTLTNGAFIDNFVG
jgi:hypothetical protein